MLLAKKKHQKRTLIYDIAAARQHLFLLHKNSSGYVCLTKGKPRWKESFRSYQDWEAHLANYLAEGCEDVYIGQNSFKIKRRRSTDLKELRATFVDLDFYKEPCAYANWTAEQVFEELRQKYYGTLIPEPTYTLFSGRGLSLVWVFKDSMPVNAEAESKWEAMGTYLRQTLLPFNADPAVRDFSRVLRLAGTINSKSGEITKLLSLHHEYEFNELHKEITTLCPAPETQPQQPKENDTNKKNKTQTARTVTFNPSKKKKQSTSPKKGVFAESKPTKIRTLQNLFYTRIKDLETLQKLRNEKNDPRMQEGLREFMCFLYYNWAMPLKGSEEAFLLVKAFNEKFLIPLKEEELEQKMVSVDRIYEKWLTNFDKNGNLAPQGNEKYTYEGYCYTNELLIKKLEITLEEEEHLQTIISKATKHKRNNERRRQQRRDKDGLTKRERQKKETQQKINQLLKEGYTKAETARQLNLSKAIVSIYAKLGL